MRIMRRVMSRSRSHFVALMVGLLACPSFSTWGTGNLTGLRAVKVGVDLESAASLNSIGVTQDALRAAVQLRLRKNGITLATDVDEALYVIINALPATSTNGEVAGYAVWVSIQVFEPVVISRADSRTLATTYETAHHVICTADSDGKDFLTGTILERIDVFSADYLAANPSGR